MYLKLLIPQRLPNDTARCLFLDVDIIINSDIDPLYTMDLNNAILAAAEDIPDCIMHKNRLGLDSNEKYINSGA